jgi:phosphatidate cytidylyltransferase
MNNLLQRLSLFFLGIPLIIAVIVFFPQAKHGAIVLVILVFTGGSTLELARLFNGKGIAVRPVAFIAIGVLVPLMAYAGSLFADTSGLSALGVLGLGTALFSVLVLAPFALIDAGRIPEAMPKASAYGFAFIYPGLFGAFIVLIASEPKWAMESLLTFALMTFGNDSLAWFTGMTIGRTRNIIAVSPNKSWAGFVGGMATSMGLPFAASAIFPHAVQAPWYALLGWGFLVGIAVIFGDLFESALKRLSRFFR